MFLDVLTATYSGQGALSFTLLCPAEATSGELCPVLGPQFNIFDIKYLKVGSQEDEAGLFSVVPGNRTRGNGLKQEHWKFHTNMKKNIFIMGVTEHYKRLPREAM